MNKTLIIITVIAIIITALATAIVEVILFIIPNTGISLVIYWAAILSPILAIGGLIIILSSLIKKYQALDWENYKLISQIDTLMAQKKKPSKSQKTITSKKNY